jgi:hypothetical protein
MKYWNTNTYFIRREDQEKCLNIKIPAKMTDLLCTNLRIKNFKLCMVNQKSFRLICQKDIRIHHKFLKLGPIS